MRRSEAMRLQWSAVDLDQGLISIRRVRIAMGAEVIEEEVAKSKSRRRQMQDLLVATPNSVHMSRLLTVAALVVALAALAVPPASAGQITFVGPNQHGVVDFGDRVPFDLRGACATTLVRVVVTVPGGTVAGPAARGCTGSVAVPSRPRMQGQGYVEGEPASVRVQAAGRSLPLRLQRAEPDQASVIAGTPQAVAVQDDPFGGVKALAMHLGDVVDLGPADLDRIESVTVRNLLREGAGSWELRVGAPDGRAIAGGDFGALGSLASAGGNGWFHSVAQLAWRVAAPVTGDRNLLGNLTPAVGGAPHVYLSVPRLSSEQVLVNWVDFNGSGASDLFTFGVEDPSAFEVLFDGSSFDGWQHTGPGRFELRDGAMRAEHDPHDVGWAWLWYSRAQYSDFALRLRFKMETWLDNGGVLLRHGDPRDDPNKVTAEADEMQIQEGFENHTGGIAHQADPERLATNLVGEWNQLEIVVVDDQWIVRINGREVTRYRSPHALRNGFISVENEQLVPGTGGHLWYDDIRVHRCSGPRDALCSTH